MKKPLPYIHDSRWDSRVSVIRLVFVGMFALLFYKFFYWQVLQADRLQAAASSQYEAVTKLAGSRGKIYSADGYVLATNKDVYTMYADPTLLSLPTHEVAGKLAQVMPIDVVATESAVIDKEQTIQEWKQTFQDRLDKKSARWVALKRKLPGEIKDEIENMHLKGIGFERDEMRSYPEASMAAHILGFVGNDARGQEQGYFGVEGAYDRELQPRSGFVKLEKDAVGVPIAVGEFDSVGSQNGRNVVLTIRRDLQFLLEEKLKAGMIRYGSKTAEAAILDPKTGAILAMASYPNYDPSKFFVFDPGLYKNLFVHDVYEPGSTMKILTVSAGIDAGVIEPDTQCDACSGPKVISGYTIKTWDNKYYPNTTMTEGLVHSDNTAMMFIAQRLGLEKFLSYLQGFGIDKKTGIDLQEESLPPGRKDWREIDVATASFGQGIAVTGIQMLNIAQAIANKGVMMRPHVVSRVEQDGQSIEVAPKELARPISPETAQKVTTMMEASALHGDAKWAIPKGYRIAGKTGTAQVPVSGHYDEEKTVASFVGFAPAEDPKFVMLVKLREPSTSPWGSETAAPLWFSIARDLFVRMNIAPRN